jgi:hypothetical protein
MVAASYLVYGGMRLYHIFQRPGIRWTSGGIARRATTSFPPIRPIAQYWPMTDKGSPFTGRNRSWKANGSIVPGGIRVITARKTPARYSQDNKEPRTGVGIQTAEKLSESSSWRAAKAITAMVQRSSIWSLREVRD